MKAVKKILKALCWIIGLVVILTIVAVLSLPLWIGPVAKTSVNAVGPKFTKTHVNLGDFGLNFYSGKFHMGDFQLENPAGYSQREAFTLGKLEVEVEPMSVMSDVIHIRKIYIKDVFASYLFANGKSNIDQLMINAGAKSEIDKEEAKVEDEKKLELDKSTAQATAQVEKPVDNEPQKPSKKVIIDRLEISGVLVQFTVLPIPVPPLVLTDIGKKSNGVQMEDVYKQVSDAIMKSAGALGDGLKSLGGALGSGAMQLGDGAMQLGNGAIQNASETAAKAGEALSNVADGAGKALNGVTDGAGKALNGAADKLNDAGKMIKGLFD